MAVGTSAMIEARGGLCSGITPVAANGTSNATLHVDRQWQPP